MSDRRLVVGDCLVCGEHSDAEFDSAMITKSGERIYRRGVAIVHRCGHVCDYRWLAEHWEAEAHRRAEEIDRLKALVFDGDQR